jgi:signal transduction histidine kinase
MKIKIKTIFIIITIFLLARFASNYVDDISRSLVNHIEAGNFINTEDLKTDKITMLHWFAKESQVYSEDNRKLYFTVFQPYNGLTLYKNKKLIMQNESKDYPMYQENGYMVFDIENDDYINNRVDFYFDVTLDNTNETDYYNNYFVGSYSNINRLIVTKNSIKVIAITLLIVISLLVLLTEKNKLYSIWFLIPLSYIFINIKVGIILATSFFYFYSDKFYRKRTKKYLVAITFFIGYLVPYLDKWYYSLDLFLLPINFYNIYIFAFIVLSTINYMKDKNKYSLISLIGISVIYIFIKVDYEFSFFRLFYEEIFITIISGILLAIGIRNISTHFSSDKTVKIDLLRGISHDLRVPISTIRLNTELLEKDDFTTEINKNILIHTIKGAVDDLTSITSSLTAYMSKDSYVKGNYKTSLQDSIHHTANYFINNEKNIDIKTKVCEEEIYLHIEEVWLNRLIYNLVDNAYKYTDEYGEIVIKLRKDKRKILLSIEDNGIGMTKEEIDKILEPFYRVDKSRSISGLGLGLSIVKSIVEKLDGNIKIVSKLGEGTKFTIEI